MENLLKQILKLPPSPFSEVQLTKIGNFFEQNQIEDKASLEDRWHTLDPDEIPAFMKSKSARFYLNAWFNLCAALTTWINFVNNIWQQETSEQINCDELLELIIALLPNENRLLSSIQKSLQPADEISQFGMYAFVSKTFFHAIEYKLANPNPTLNPKPQEIAHLIWQIEQIDQLNFICENYFEKLMEMFKQRLKFLKQLSYNHFFSDDKTTKNSFESILDDRIKSEHERLLPDDSQLENLLKRCQLIDEMHLTLVRQDRQADEILEEFRQKLLLFLPDLETNYPSSGQFYSDSFFYHLNATTRFFRAPHPDYFLSQVISRSKAIFCSQAIENNYKFYNNLGF